MNWKPYWRVLASSARENSANPRQIVAAISVSLFRVFLLSAIYAVAYKFGKAGLSYENSLWSLAVYFGFILNLGIRDLFKVVEQDVQSGEVEVQLIKPLDWRLVKACQVIGKNCIEFAVQLVVMPIFLLLIVGLPNISFWSPAFLLGFLLLTIFAVVSASCLFMIIGLTAFWLHDAKPVYRIFDKTIMVFGGAYVPIALLPHVAQTIVRYSPFGVYAAPTQLFNPGVTPVLASYLLSAVFWTISLIVLNNFVWHKAQGRIEVNGG